MLPGGAPSTIPQVCFQGCGLTVPIGGKQKNNKKTKTKLCLFNLLQVRIVFVWLAFSWAVLSKCVESGGTKSARTFLSRTSNKNKNDALSSMPHQFMGILLRH